MAFKQAYIMYYNVQQQQHKLNYWYYHSAVCMQVTQLHAYISSIQSNAAAITLSGSGFGRIRRWISDHIRFRPDFKNV